MSVLDEICAQKREHIEQRKLALPLIHVRDLAEAHSQKPLLFIDAITAHEGISIIAEIKKASPSKGIIRADFDAHKIASTYQDNGACCVSVLTDAPYFQGCDDDLRAVKAAISRPALRKDFLLDAYQIYESRALGADCILLIMAALEDAQARDLYDLSTALGMDVLVEIHDAAELDRAIALRPRMIGVNNRSLKTLVVDVQTSLDLAAHMPRDVVKIAESGLSDYATILRLKAAGYNGFLIGESMMRESDIGAALRSLQGLSQGLA